MNAVLPIARAAPADDRRRAWITCGTALGFAVFALLLLFRSDVADLADIYWNSSDYGHCLFILPIAAWLVWQRREGLAQLTPQPWAPGLALALAAAALWVIGAAAGAGILRHLALVTMLQAAVVTLLGPRVARAIAFPLAYCWFLVPFGDSFQAPLQQLTAAMAMQLLALSGIDAVSDGVLITTSAGYFEVAEACSGAGFVIAMIAFGALGAHVGFVTWHRRIIFFAFAIAVPILANGVRAFSTIVAAHLTSIEAATGFDHIVYGWFFFAFVLAAVIAGAWRWFDRDPRAAWFDPGALQRPVRHRLPASVAACALVACAFAAIGWNAVIAGRFDRLPAAITLPDVAGWQRTAMSTRAPWVPVYRGADHFLHGRYADGTGATVDLAIAVYARQGEGRELAAFGQGAIGEDSQWVWIEDRPDLRGGHVIRMTAPGPVERETATWYRVGDKVTGSETIVKLETLKARLLGGRQSAVAVVASAETVPGTDSRATLARFLDALGPIDRVADTAAGR
ncbi:exosortase A [Sphingomonas japonica]|uniref:Exosortase A n=1 Tax=Sphingomonas japonica TaxID=511662 RepID=A0ABX0U5C1_9SPHN|nr:exosortase A [Sphingomonas japonica]NIJ25024.1 exosortase A [Sphingomonas japonica]